MKTVKYVLIGLVILLNVSCDKDDEFELNETNYLIFGHFYGECFGEGCIEIFKLTGDKLFEDTNDNYSGEDLNFIELENDEFEQVKDLANIFPEQLLNEDKSTFGCPDCADGGGLFIQYSKNGNLKSWRIDQNKDNVPSYLHNFIDKVNEKIGLINK
jgi:hypothetical protein